MYKDVKNDNKIAGHRVHREVFKAVNTWFVLFNSICSAIPRKMFVILKIGSCHRGFVYVCNISLPVANVM